MVRGAEVVSKESLLAADGKSVRHIRLNQIGGGTGGIEPMPPASTARYAQHERDPRSRTRLQPTKVRPPGARPIGSSLGLGTRRQRQWNSVLTAEITSR